jgi:hypothetical protein
MHFDPRYSPQSRLDSAAKKSYIWRVRMRVSVNDIRDRLFLIREPTFCRRVVSSLNVLQIEIGVAWIVMFSKKVYLRVWVRTVSMCLFRAVKTLCGRRRVHGSSHGSGLIRRFLGDSRTHTPHRYFICTFKTVLTEKTL